MKKIIIAIAGFAILLIACTKQQNMKIEERTVVAPFHITKLLMQPADSTEAPQASLPYDQIFLSREQFGLFEKNVWALFKDSTSQIYYGSDPNEKPMNKKEFLEAGKDWNLKHITSLECFETWYFNPQNNMMERDVLGYGLFEYVPDKQAYRILGYLFRNEADRKKVNDNYLAWD